MQHWKPSNACKVKVGMDLCICQQSLKEIVTEILLSVKESELDIDFTEDPGSH